MGNLAKDLKYGARVLLKSPGFAIVAILSLALGIGANTAVFSMVTAFMLAPLPVDRPNQLVTIFATDQKNPGNLQLSDLNFQDYRSKNDVFTGVLAYAFGQLDYSKSGESKQVFCELTTANYFDLLGVKVLAGRSFLPDEDKTPGANAVAVISYKFWQREFGGSPSAIGTTLNMNRHDFTVIGVADRQFTGTDLGPGPDLWVPISMHAVAQPGFDWYNTRRGLFLSVIGRLKSGVSVQQASVQMTALGQQLEREYPADNSGRNAKLVPLLQARINPDGQGAFLRISGVMLGVVLIILLIACANVANLLLPRAIARKKEIAIRLATGASRMRLISQMMTESLMLAVTGGAIGILVAFWSRNFIQSLDLFGVGPNAPIAKIDVRVLMFTGLVTLASALIFGLTPAIQATKADLVSTLKGEVLPTSERTFGLGLGKLLIIGQVALSLVSLVGAGLFIRSLQKAEEVNPGFNTDRILLMQINLGREGYSEDRGREFHRQLLEKLKSDSAIDSACFAENAPFGGGIERTVFVEGQEPGVNGRGVLVQTNSVGEGFFQTLGVTLLRGREFGPDDKQGAPKTAIINQTMAADFWPGQDAIGKRFKFFGDTEYRQVVGIARDAKYNTLVEHRLPFVYLPLLQEYASPVTLFVHSTGDTARATSSVRDQVRSLDAGLPLLGITTMKEVIDQSLAGQKTGALLLSVFGGVALLLAAVGLYGVTSYSVAQRTREIGIRMAIGADQRSMVRMVLGQGMILVSIGLGVGAVAAFIVTRLISTLLFGVSAADPTTFGATIGVLAAVALIANYIPARRATRVNPVVALRYQ